MTQEEKEAAERLQGELDKRPTVREKREYLQKVAMGTALTEDAPKEE